MTPIDNSVTPALSEALGRLSRGTSIAASNIANVDTPGYRALQVEFAEALGNAGAGLAGTAKAHRASREAVDRGVVSEAPSTRQRADGNTVDIDHEMTKLATLGGRFAATAQMLRKHLALLRYAATDGRQ